MDRRVDLLREAGADEVGVFRTGPWLLGLSAREFFDRVIVGQFSARGRKVRLDSDREGFKARPPAWVSRGRPGQTRRPPRSGYSREIPATLTRRQAEIAGARRVSR